MSLFLERVGTWFRELGSIKWVAGAGIAYAALMFAILPFLKFSGGETEPHLQPASYEPNASEPILEVDFENGRNFRSKQNSQQEF